MLQHLNNPKFRRGKKNPIVTSSNSGYDAGGVKDPTLFFEDATFYCYYSAFTDADEAREDVMWAVACSTATNPEGPWTKQGIQIPPSTSPDDWDFRKAGDPALFAENGIYYLYYEIAYPPTNRGAIGVATASHPLGPWKKYEGNPILKVSPPTGWDSFDFYAPRLVKWKDSYYLFYDGSNTADVEARQVGFAQGLSPLGPFTKYPGNPVFSLPNTKRGCEGPSLVNIRDRWLMFFTGWDDNDCQNIQLATSENLIDWKYEGVVLSIDDGELWENVNTGPNSGVGAPGVLLHEDKLILAYQGKDAKRWSLGIAVADLSELNVTEKY
ncbi:MAG: family 43 glycosylhydrolase [Bacteroidota bacterium]